MEFGVARGTEDPPRPVGDAGGPQVGENTEGCEALQASKPTMFSTAKVASGEWSVVSGQWSVTGK